MYNLLLQSDLVNQSYKKIEQDEQISGTARHDLSHVLSVVDLVENVLVQLDVDEEFIQASKIAALLHDLGCVDGKKGHALNSYHIVKDYLEKEQLNLAYQNEVLEAIKDHGSSFDSDSLMTLVLIMCDKIDLRKQRLAPEGFETIGIRQLQYIEDIRVLIHNDSCIVDFIAHQDIDLEEFNSFKFLSKTFASIVAFASFNNLEPFIRMNGQPWLR